jgi:hypothetical protein
MLAMATYNITCRLERRAGANSFDKRVRLCAHDDSGRMSVELFLYLVLLPTAFVIGLAAKSPGKALLIPILTSFAISTFLVLWYRSFFPFEVSEPEMHAYEHYSPGQLVLVWLYFRVGARAAIAEPIGLLGYLVMQRFFLGDQ